MKFAIVALLIIIAFIAGGLLSPFRYKEIETVKEIVISDNVSTVYISVPAVDAEGRGVVSNITVQAMPGSGRVLTNIDKLLFWIDTQYSIQVAKAVAKNITGIDMSNFDLVYTIKANASLVEGPSAGAAITVATIAAIQNKSINQSIMLTGTIEEDGSIGPVGAISQKIAAAKQFGAKLFLVPKGSLVEISSWQREQKCTKKDGITWCEINYVPIPKDLGIEIKEVKDISQVLEYILI
jgi:uncharacterized protein